MGLTVTSVLAAKTRMLLTPPSATFETIEVIQTGGTETHFPVSVAIGGPGEIDMGWPGNWGTSSGGLLAVATLGCVVNPPTQTTVSVIDSRNDVPLAQLGGYALSEVAEGAALVALSLWWVPNSVKSFAVLPSVNCQMLTLFAMCTGDLLGQVSTGGGGSAQTPTLAAVPNATGATMVSVFAHAGGAPTYSPGSGFTSVKQLTMKSGGDPNPVDFGIYMDTGAPAVNTPTFSVAPQFWAAAAAA